MTVKAENIILSAHGIVNRFGKQTVHNGIDIDVVRGEVLGIAGGSGSGKSVLLRTLAGLHIPTKGKVLAGASPVDHLSAVDRAAFFGMLFQHGALFSSLTTLENIMLPMREHTQLTEAEQIELAHIKLAMAGLEPDAAAKYPSTLSGGMVKRAALARALALDPRVLLLDEPTAGLDPNLADGIDELIGSLNENLGVTVVVVTHDLNTLFGVCDRMAILVDGKISIGKPEVLARSKLKGVHDYLSGPRVDFAMAALNKPANRSGRHQKNNETQERQ
ncbi:MAG: ATP-binding cassette domain-containing protein [Betaproteobacteria bacterium]